MKNLASHLLFFVAAMFSSAAPAQQHSIFADDKCAESYEYHFLNRAASAGDLIGVELLLRAGANPNSHANDAYATCVAGTDPGSALMTSVSRQHVEIVRLLVKAGANPHTPEGDGTTPYQVALQAGNRSIIVILEGYR